MTQLRQEWCLHCLAKRIQIVSPATQMLGRNLERETEVCNVEVGTSTTKQMQTW